VTRPAPELDDARESRQLVRKRLLPSGEARRLDAGRRDDRGSSAAAANTSVAHGPPIVRKRQPAPVPSPSGMHVVRDYRGWAPDDPLDPEAESVLTFP
jgi:hypothetical protein